MVADQHEQQEPVLNEAGTEDDDYEEHHEEE